MKRKISAIILVTVLLGSLMVGCGTKDTNDNTGNNAAPTEGTNQETPSTENITLKVWESTGGPDAFITQAGEAFNKLYPNITVEYVNVELANSTTQIALDGPAGVGPDLFAAPHDKLGELVSGGHILQTVNSEEITSKVLGTTSTALTYDGAMYGYPVSAETYALFYNKELISEDEVPKTWDEVVAFSEKFNEENAGKYGFMMNVGDGYYSIIFTTSDNNRLFGPNGNDITSTNINSEASIKGMEFFQGLRKILDIPAADINTSIGDAAFGSGNAAMYITGLWNVANFESQGIDFGVAALPSLPGNDTPVASFSGTRAMFVSAYSEHPEEAALFAEFLLSEEMQQLRFELTGSLPAIDIAVDSPYIAGFLKQLEYAFPMPSIPQMSAYWDAMNSASANIWDGADIKTELDAVNSTILGQ